MKRVTHGRKERMGHAGSAWDAGDGAHAHGIRMDMQELCCVDDGWMDGWK